MSMKKIEYVGQEYETKNYGKIRVIKDLGLHKIYENIDQRYRLLQIQFLNTGTILTIKSSELSRLQMKDPYAKTVCGVGFLGEANNYTKKEYDIWYHMIYRCYNIDDSSYPTYGAVGVHVCTRWFNFSNFLEDLRKMENYDKLMSGEKYQLDKDILQPNITYKIYSPETCLLIPSHVNNAEVFKRNLDNKEVKYNGVYNTGCKDYNDGYIARICINNKKYNLGTYDDAKSAAAVRDEIAWMYRRLDLLNHTGVSFNEAIIHKRGRYNSVKISEILSNLPPRNMCSIIDNTKLRQMCYIITPIKY